MVRAAKVQDDLKEQCARILAGEHGDPFAFLGPHRQGSGKKSGFVLRCFLPGAAKVSILPAPGEDGKEAPSEILMPAEILMPSEIPMPAEILMTEIAAGGLFSASLSAAPGRYRLRVVWGSGLVQELDDPYRFSSTLGEIDLHLLAEGTHLRSFEKLGAHPREMDGVAGVAFAVWAPNAKRVSVVGGFNLWDGRRHPMRLHPGGGLWEIFLPGLAVGELYKFEILAADGTRLPAKSDPYGFQAELPPRTASVVANLPSGRDWHDLHWLERREALHRRDAPISIYEVHLASWKRVPEEGNRPLTYLELADDLADYVIDMGFTHVEFLPLHEHPFSGSWGYQPIGLFAPTSRHGTPEHFRILVERLHQRGIGVIMDWVAGHFPRDEHGLARFDGTHLYEHQDPRLGLHRDWDTLIYNYGRHEVTNYLIANALYWLEVFHVDGLRVDAVASMLYLDYSREAGEWIPNRFGGNENLEAVDFIQRLNSLVYAAHPGILTVAEESTAWPGVSHPVDGGGLGFGYKWNMGWMNDTLRYMSLDPVHRRFHHHEMTFGMHYAYTENFVLPLSHDEVVHGKGSLLGRMTGDIWQRFANLRAYYTFMWTHPGKKLLFMGGEFGQAREWDHNGSLDWHLVDVHSPQQESHRGVQKLIRDLNHLYRAEPALHELDCDPEGFRWIVVDDADNSVLAYERRARGGAPGELGRVLVVVANFTPVVREDYRIGVPGPGRYQEKLNSDSCFYGGSDVHNGAGVEAEPISSHGYDWSISLRLPPLGTLVLGC